MTGRRRGTSSAVYGSREWLDREYRRVDEDPWGLDWRPSQVERYHRMIEVLVAQLGVRQARHILDIGCATGTFTAMLAAALGGPDVEIRGIDVAQLAISRARLRLPQLAFECLTVEEAESRFIGAFDVVTMLEVLYYVPEKERAAELARIRRMLKPGGVLLVSSMVAREPYMSPSELRALVGTSLRVIEGGVLALGPLARIEKTLLRPMVLAGRLGGPRPPATVPKRRRSVQALERLWHRIFGDRAVSHSYVLAVAEGDGQS